MATPQSSLIIKRYDGFGGNFVDSQYLGAAYETGKPHMLENTLTRIFSSRSKYFTSKLVTSLTGGKAGGSEVMIDTEIFRWRLQGAEYKCARQVENLESSNTVPGLNNTAFRIKLDLDYYAAPDVLLGMDNEYPLQIVDGPIADGTGFIYTVKIQGDNPSVYVPASMLEVGAEFSKAWTTVASEYNDEGGTQQYTNSFLLESQVGAFAQKLTITDKAWRDQGRLAVDFLHTDMSGKTSKISRFLPYAEALMWDELYQSIEAQLVYGKKQTQPGPNGYWKKTGPGLREQLKDGWTQYYSGALSISMMKDYLMDIFFTRTDETERKVTAVTGTLGSEMFHDALVAIANGYLTVDTNWIEKIPSNVDTPYLAYGAQFTRYRGPEGVVIDLNKNSMYDDRRYCKRTHPQYPNRPIDSARMTFLDFGTTKGSNNIRMLKVKDSFSHGYIPGTHTPTGPIKGGMGTAFKAGYDLWAQGTAGIVIIDPTLMGELIMETSE